MTPEGGGNDWQIKVEEVPNSGYQYKYSSIEWQDEMSLNLYDHGARNYDPATGRWNVIDAFAGMYVGVSPYNYALNNPVVFVDPNGHWVTRIGYYGKLSDQVTHTGIGAGYYSGLGDGYGGGSGGFGGNNTSPDLNWFEDNWDDLQDGDTYYPGTTGLWLLQTEPMDGFEGNTMLGEVEVVYNSVSSYYAAAMQIRLMISQTQWYDTSNYYVDKNGIAVWGHAVHGSNYIKSRKGYGAHTIDISDMTGFRGYAGKSYSWSVLMRWIKNLFIKTNKAVDIVTPNTKPASEIQATNKVLQQVDTTNYLIIYSLID